MKKLVIFLIPLIVSIPAFAQDKSLFTENFSLVKYSRDNIKSFFNLDIASPVNYLFDTEKKGHFKQYQTFQIPMFHQLSELIYFSMDSVIERKEQNREKPPLSKKRVVNEILAGGGLGVIGGLALGAAGIGIGLLLAGDEEEYLWALGGLIGAGLGYAAGSALGVYLVGDNANETGSFGATFLGGLLGTGLGYAILFATQEGLTFYMSLPIPPILACIGFNMTRRYKSSPSSESGLLNFREGQINLGIPMVLFQPDPFVKRALAMNVNLISVEF